TSTPYPLHTRTSTADINSIRTTATLHPFADKLLFTITQSTPLTHWLHVPLSGDSPLTDPSVYITPQTPSPDDPDASLLPFPHLTATTVLGGTKSEDEVLGQTVATTVASAVVMRRPGERRMVVFGLGLQGAGMGRREFEGVVGLCL
ncbi:hypothetical protein BDV97DRAFT_284332, partial [Delphinella strobiligena]